MQQDIRENTLEFTKAVEEAHKIEAEIPVLKAKLREDENRLAHLKPEIQKLERDKMEIHRELQQVEEENRHQINEHLTDRNKMIKPLGHH